jgi:antitoxin HicB
MEKYSVAVQWSEDDEGYIATIPELTGLSAFGVTKEEALSELEVAKEAYLEVFIEDGCQLPEPDTLNSFSGQTRLRLPKSLHASLSRKAKMEGVSLNTYIIHLLSERNIGHQIERKIEVLEEGVQSLLSQQHINYYFTNEGYPQDQIAVTGSKHSYQISESNEFDEKSVH